LFIPDPDPGVKRAPDPGSATLQKSSCFVGLLSDEHEVDVIGYGGHSDDDQSSIRSNGSDGGMGVNTWRQLTIADIAL
jgi:hypothetical protein